VGDTPTGVLRGDGIGPEIVEATLTVLEAAQQRDKASPLRVGSPPHGWDAIRATGSALPESAIEALEKCDAWILGPHDSVSYPAALRSNSTPAARCASGSTCMRTSARRARTWPTRGLPQDGPGHCAGKHRGVLRRSQHGLGDRRVHADPGCGPGRRQDHAAGFERIARTAFALARQRRRKVAIVHKANVLRKTSGLFLDVCRGVGAEFPDVAVEDYHIDAMTALLVRRGADFDVIVTENMFGDILSDLTGELSGSLGMAPSINASATQAMAQASHGSAPDIAGKGIANPVGMILSAAMLLAWLGGERKDPAAADAGQAIERAVAAAPGKRAANPRPGGDRGHQGLHLGHRATPDRFVARTTRPAIGAIAIGAWGRNRATTIADAESGTGHRGTLCPLASRDRLTCLWDGAPHLHRARAGTRPAVVRSHRQSISGPGMATGTSASRPPPLLLSRRISESAMPPVSR